MKLPGAGNHYARAYETTLLIYTLTLPFQKEQASSQVHINYQQQENGQESVILVSMSRISDAEAELNLPPGFRFHPTDEELVVHYLCRKAAHLRLPVPIIAEVNLYKFDPWELPERALFGQKEWYFFTPRDRKYPNGSRPNRAAGRGYWKATGADKPVLSTGSSRPLGIKKALVFYSGKAPKGAKTDWIMHEYRLAETNRSANKKNSLRLDEWVLCRLYNKKNAWNKMQKSIKETSSLEETMDSVEDTGSESFRTPESDVDDSLPEFDNLGMPSFQMAICGKALSFKGLEHRPKEEDNDWFMDLNLDEIEGLESGSMTTTLGAFDSSLTQDYFYQALCSPHLKPSLTNLPPF